MVIVFPNVLRLRTSYDVLIYILAAAKIVLFHEHDL